MHAVLLCRAAVAGHAQQSRLICLCAAHAAPARPRRSGGVPAHHMLGRYALSLAAVVKAQASTPRGMPLRLGRAAASFGGPHAAPTAAVLTELPCLPPLACRHRPHTHAVLLPRPHRLPQFSASKWLLGGRAGAAQLVAAVDLGEALTLCHMDLASLQVGLRCFYLQLAVAIASSCLMLWYMAAVHGAC